MTFASPQLLGAVTGAAAHDDAQTHMPMRAPEPATFPPRAMTEIRRARLEIDGGQQTKAIGHIRAATKRLRVCVAPATGDILATLAAAAWLVRADQHLLAERALDLALGYMSGQSAAG